MLATADAAQLCGIVAIVTVQSNLPRLAHNLRKGLACALRSGYTAAVRGRGGTDEATKLKQFPYMKLLDSNCARKEY